MQLGDNTHYNALGKPISKPADSQLFACAPKAIVDLTIRLARKK